ncbi:helix-turn-helix domain-containing protein [Actinoplanes xinjiangensis]|uniref:Helix-turn-helix protein n=1 Tax=Actinoplanes xinjiangensis TaxID=512350 RepID=A0A316FDX2_9ACTN|nr:helix-turn-helix transcriptional regulator [Actinoplanes xinjiangensis]PWK47078.1 helix-turn-helix protein [Actinoplanes xinjiangensis]GIF40237.1 transcriptional regulator [Actinoplanes xinjiangensis]
MSEDRGSSSEKQTVGALLRARREELRLSGSALAVRAGLTQSKVSRIETGQSSASPDDVRRLAEAMRLAPAEVDELVRLATESRSGSAMDQWRPENSSQLTRKQVELQEAEWTAREIRIFQPSIVPGLVQVSGYAEAVMRPWYDLPGGTGRATSDLFAAVAARLQRQQILSAADKFFHLVLTEATLSNRLGNPEDMVAQIRRIREIAERDNVTIEIIPADAALTFPLSHSFELLDDTHVLIDLYTVSLTSEVVSDIQSYRQIFDILAAAATTDIKPILDQYADLYLSLSARR